MVRIKTVKSKTRRPEKVTTMGFPERGEDEHTLELHGMYAYGKH